MRGMKIQYHAQKRGLIFNATIHLIINMKHTFKSFLEQRYFNMKSLRFLQHEPLFYTAKKEYPQSNIQKVIKNVGIIM